MRFLSAFCLLLLPLFTEAAQIDVSIPGASTGFAVGGPVTALPNGNFVVVESRYSVPGGASEAGAVRLFSVSGTLISTLTGTAENDQVGSGGIKVLSNGNFIVLSPLWDNGAATDAGAVTWGSAMTGVEGPVSASNSLVGSATDDGVGNEAALNGSYPVVVLDNGNYVVNTPGWDNEDVQNAGAVTWGDGTAGVKGAISAGNSLVGLQNENRLGSGGITVLKNGHCVVASPNWSSSSVQPGAVTWMDKATGIQGTISAANSLIGASSGDSLGYNPYNGGTVVPLSNGDYIVCAPLTVNTESTSQHNPGDCGSATWCSGATGRAGVISSATSLMGYRGGARVGSGGVKELTNGAVVVISEYWTNSVTDELGAVTWCPNAAGMTGFVTTANSLVGSTAEDRVGHDGVTALTNGNYVVASTYWDNGAAEDAGAATWGSGATGAAGVVSAANSLVGGQTQDRIGDLVVALSNGNAVVASSIWANGAVGTAGAATWMNGTTGLTGLVTTVNSLHGTTTGDRVGGSVVPLTNGNYVVLSVLWNNGAEAGSGAATWCDGTTGRAGPVTAVNSLHGVGLGDVVALKGNGNYVVCNSGTTAGGFAAWGNGNGGLTGAVSAANALIGGHLNDGVGSKVLALANGNYVVVSDQWTNPNGTGGTALSAGAVTWGSGTAGVKGLITADNSLVGMKEGDFVGGGSSAAGVFELMDGNYLVLSIQWDNPEDKTPPTINAGAATWCSGTTGRKGGITQSNSLVGDGTLGLGLWKRKFLPGGGYLLSGYGMYFDSSNVKTEVRATSLGLPMGQTTGVMSVANTVVDRIPQSQVFATTYHSFDYDAARQRMLVGRYGVKTVTILQPTLPPPKVSARTAPLPALAAPLVIEGVNFSPLPGDNSVLLSGGATGEVTAATTTQLTLTNLTGLQAGPLKATVNSRGVSSGKAVQVANVVPAITASSAPLGAGATTFLIQGGGFSATASKNVLTFSNGAKGTVTAATTTTLTVKISGLTLGTLNASVKVNGVASGSTVQVATVVPEVMERTAHMGASATSLMIYGAGFSTILTDNAVTFGGGITGTVVASTPTSLSVDNLSGLSAGVVTAEVTTSGISSGTPVQVATVIPPASGSISFAAATYTTTQDATSVVLTLERTDSTSATGVTIHTDDGTASVLPSFKEAVAGVDYVELAGPATTVDFAAAETTRTLTLTLLPKKGAAVPNRRFIVTLSDPVAGATLGGTTQTTVEILATDTIKPTVAITAPAANANVAEGDSVTMTGSASDGKGVTKVQVSHNGGAFNDVPITSGGGLKVNFSRSITPVPGVNTLAARSMDMRGNMSAVAARSFNYNVIRPLETEVTPAGSGTVASSLPLANYKTGFRYTIEAKPSAGKVFDGWIVSDAAGAGVTPAMLELPKLTFTHQESLKLTAKFIDNPFTPEVAGNFTGLVMPDALLPDREPAGAGAEDGTPGSNETFGSLTAAVTTKGTHTGTLKIDGLELRFTGVLDNHGDARFGANRDTTLTLMRTGKPPLELALHLDLSGGSGLISGTVTQRQRGTAQAVSNVLAERAAYSTTHKLEAGFSAVSGKAFTLMFQHRPSVPGLTATDYPQGDGYATGTLSTAGAITFGGKLADDTAVSFAAPLGKTKRWPLYASLYSKKGSIGGWVTVDPGETDSDMDGAGVTWYRPYQAVQWYPWGWPEGIPTDVLASVYAGASSPVLSGLSAPDPTTGNVDVIFSAGLLASPLHKAVNIAAGNKVTTAPAGDKSFTFSLVPASGQISGTLTPAGGAKTAWRGVLLQKGANRRGGGYFMTPKPKAVDGAGESGEILLLPK